jgi:hypothetical protein
LRGNCLPKHFIGRKIEGMIEVKGKTGTRRKQSQNELKEEIDYWKLKRKH